MSKGEFELNGMTSDAESPSVVLKSRAAVREGTPDSGIANSAYVRSTDTFGTTIDLETDGEPIQPQQEKYSDRPEDEENCCTKAVSQVTTGISAGVSNNSRCIKIVFGLTLVCLWVAYFIGAMYYAFQHGWDSTNEPAIRLIAINVIALFCVVYWAIKKYLGKQIWREVKPVLTNITQFVDEKWYILRWILAIVLLVALGLILGLDVGMKAPGNLISLLGMVTYIVLFYVFSYSPSQVKWRPVIGGLILQFVFAYLILRTCFGFLLFKWLGDRVQEFLTHTDAGSKFIFGVLYDVNFGFKVLPVVIFFSTAISMLYYLGVMQVVIKKVAWIMEVFMGTTAGESLNAAGNIFVGQTEAPLMIKPLIKDMTNSEIHAVMTGGFATIAGSVLATYILMGVPANHLLSASVMSAPAALAMSKLFYPETQRSKTTTKDISEMGASEDRNLVEAASSGASTAVKLVANIAANLIAFLALLQFINETLKWFGARVGLAPPGYPDFTFQFICSYVLYPFAWVMGTPADDCKQVASLIGVKTFTNEFIAYSDLALLIKNREIVATWGGNATFDLINNCYTLSNSTFTANNCLSVISERAEVIAVYALCGFANLGSIGIMLGGLGAMCPERKKDMATIVLRAMVAGNVACFMTACIAGLLTIPGGLDIETCGSI